MTGSYVGCLQELQELMALGRAGELAPWPVSLRPLADAAQALEELRTGKVRGRTVLCA